MIHHVLSSACSRLRLWLIRALCASALLGCMACTSALCEDAPQLLDPVGVKMDTAVAYIGDIQQIEVYDASVAPRIEELYFEIEGVIQNVYVSVGQMVNAGDPLLSLDQDDILEELKLVQEDLAFRTADAAYADALADVDLRIHQAQLEQLMLTSSDDAQAIALKKLDIEQFRLDTQLAQDLRRMELARLQQRVDELLSLVHDGTLYAPFSGRIMHAASITTGSRVTAYSPLLFLADDAKLSIRSEFITSTTLAAAKEIYALIGSEKYSLTHVPTEDEDYVSKILSGETLTSEFSFDAPDDTLHPGMYAALCIVTRSARDVLLIPSNALYHDASGRYVYTLENGSRVRRAVKVGITTDWLVQILDGLEEGAVVYVTD